MSCSLIAGLKLLRVVGRSGTNVPAKTLDRKAGFSSLCKAEMLWLVICAGKDAVRGYLFIFCLQPDDWLTCAPVEVGSPQEL